MNRVRRERWNVAALIGTVLLIMAGWAIYHHILDTSAPETLEKPWGSEDRSGDEHALPQPSTGQAEAPEDAAGVDEYRQFLSQVREALWQASELRSSDLESSDVYEILNRVKVRDDFVKQRESLVRLLDTDLPNFARALRHANLDHYFDHPDGRALPPSEQKARILEELAKIEYPVEGCDDLQDAFRALVEDPEESAIRAWCRLARRVSGLSEPKRSSWSSRRPPGVNPDQDS